MVTEFIQTDSELADLMESSPLYNEAASTRPAPAGTPPEGDAEGAARSDALEDDYWRQAIADGYESEGGDEEAEGGDEEAVEDEEEAGAEPDGEHTAPQVTPGLLDHLRQVFMAPQQELPEAQRIPEPPVDKGLLNDDIYQARLQSVEAQFLPHFQAARAAGDEGRAQAIAIRYEAAKEKVVMARERASTLLYAHQLAGEYVRMRTVAEQAARIVYAFTYAAEHGLDPAKLLTHPGTGKPVRNREEMDGLVALLTTQRKQSRRAAAPPPAPTLSGGGAPAARRGTAEQQRQRTINSLSPFSKDFERIERLALAGHAVDLARVRPRKPAARRGRP